MNCRIPDEVLAGWEGVTNPINQDCNFCDNINCEHNLNYRSEE